jgi:hypothetical protein
MDWRRITLCIVLSGGLGVAACDGSLPPARVDAGALGPAIGDETPWPDAAAYALDGGAEDAPPFEEREPDARWRSDAPRDLISAPLPADVPPPARIVAGKARLVGVGATACSSQEPPSGNGDRWCAFRRPGADGLGTELWVFNLSAAMAGRAPVCDGSSLDCLRMTTSLWTEEGIGGPTQDSAHRFDGDTLIFHTPGTSSRDDAFRGPIWAWRPGWSQPRMLTANGLICYSHDRLPLVFCMENADISAAIEFDLRAASIAGPTFEPLRLVDRARVRRADFEQAFQGWWTSDGQYFLFSSTSSPEAKVAGLRVVKTEEIGSTAPREILPDVMSWSLANDERRVYYLAQYGADTAQGTLMMADFPGGENPGLLAQRTGRYVVLNDGSARDRGVGYFHWATGRFLSEYRVISDRDDLSTNHVVFRYKDLLEDFHVSANQRYTGYAKFDSKEGFNGYIARTDGSGECILNSDPARPAYEYYFLESTSMVFWEEESEDDSTASDGWFGDPDGCRDKHRFASHIGYYVPVRNEGLIYGDDVAGETMSLKYARIEGGRTWPAGGGARIHERVDRSPVIIGKKSSHILFQVSLPEQESGIYLFGPVPFGP